MTVAGFSRNKGTGYYPDSIKQDGIWRIFPERDVPFMTERQATPKISFYDPSPNCRQFSLFDVRSVFELK